ncbi:MAG: glycosyltransferase, partial [Thermodesulfobacteriota bacterium]
MSDLWVIAPVYNEEKNLTAFVEEWLAVLRRVVETDFTFCLINDGSTDGSHAILNRLATIHPELRIISKINTGHGPTCRLAYELAVQAGAQWVFQIDSDGQCDPALFETFWNARSRAPVHYGVRRAREDGWIRRLISRALTVLVFLLSSRWVRDANVPYRLMRRDALEPALKQIPRDFRLANALLALLHQENPGIEWHVIPFHRRTGRQLPVDLPFFLGQGGRFIADYLSWHIQRRKKSPAEWLMTAGHTLLVLCAVYYIVTLIVLAPIKAFVLVEYDWVEGFHMAQVHRLLAGNPVYAEPSLEYVPILYGPLYAYISSAFVLILGEHYGTLRLVSLLATLGTQVILGWIVWRKTRSLLGALVASGLYAGMYAATGFFYDLARVDALYVFLTTAAACAIWIAAEKGGTATAAAALAAVTAVLTKQPALLPVVALCLWSLTLNTREARTTALLCMGCVLASQALPALTGNFWFYYYLYRVPSTHPLSMN